MQSQVIWGLFFLLIGAIMFALMLPLFLLSIPFVILGSALIIFRHRESVIEEVKE